MATLGDTVDVLQLFGEPTRVRLLALLAQQELSVAELTSITELAQSRVSTHLGKLREAGVLRDQKAGASTRYALNDGAMPAEARKVWQLIAAGLDDTVVRHDRERCAAVLRARRAARWPDAIAGQMERHYSPGRTWESMARGLTGLVRLGDVLDAGAGDGVLAQLLAPRAASYTCLDRSDAVIAAARVRLQGLGNVRYEIGDVQALPFPAATFDEVLLFNVLTSVESPARALAEAARVLRPNGRLAILALAAHKHLPVTRAFEHRHPGFAPAALSRMLSRAGLDVDECAITSRERRPPYFQVVSAFATKSATQPASPRPPSKGTE